MQENLIEKWYDWIKRALMPGSGEVWDALIINKRKPHTYRAWTMLPDGNRVCLHRFDKCEEDESFAHTHGWPAEFFVLHGRYLETLWHSHYNPNEKHSRMYQPVIPVAESIYTCGSWHRIANPLTWHKITPLTKHVYTIMINEQPYSNPLGSVKTTQGKDLLEMTPTELDDHLLMIRSLM